MMVSSKTSINVYLKEIIQWFLTEWVRNPGGIHLNQFHDCNTDNTDSESQIQPSKERQCLLTILVCFLLIQPKLRHNNNYWLRTSCIFDVRVGHIQVLPGIFPKITII